MVELNLEAELNSLQSKLKQLNYELNHEKGKVHHNELQLEQVHLQMSRLQEHIDSLLIEKKELEEELESQRIKASRKKDRDLLSFSVIKQAN
jgi:chromosome segregation ATPase